MSVPVTRENCKYVYIRGREAVELETKTKSLTKEKSPSMSHTSPISLVVAEQNVTT